MTSHWLTGLLLLTLASTSYAADCPHCGLPECTIDHHARAGQPTRVHRWAIPTKTPHYSGGIVGGGAVLGGDDPCIADGTWGWDYSGLLPVQRIWLGWSHKHYQAGGGKYHTDGPRIKR